MNDIDSRINQETLEINNLIKHMVKLKTSENISYKCSREMFDVCENYLCMKN